MCIIKTNEDVVSGNDLQDLITSRISGKGIPFSKKDILQETQNLLKGSKYETDNESVMYFIEKIINVLHNNNFIVKEKKLFRLNT